ncbi:hypothetical protein PGT21_009488 [Puccinia graminis f. sp. tritici]|uniref:Uncharacterized protein n=1 Tax=Puccinia graminis f. sp. tritici TaxID=56615 RepID=A0A5B0LNX0_PUCGR|nr:hypothetical protein PGT21_009488 [Puccinia graminis f. sp. tritici]
MKSLLCFTWLVLGVVWVGGMETPAGAASATRNFPGGGKIGAGAGHEELTPPIQKAEPASFHNPSEERGENLFGEGQSPARGQRPKTFELPPTPGKISIWRGKAKEAWYRIIDHIIELLQRLMRKKDPPKEAIPELNLASMEKYPEGDFIQTKDFIQKDEKNVFRALAHLKYQDQEKHQLIEEQIIRYIHHYPSEFFKYRMRTSENGKLYDKIINVGGIDYGMINRPGSYGIIFSAFSRSTNMNIYVSSRKVPKSQHGFVEYRTTTFEPRKGIEINKGLVVENGNYEVFGCSGSEVLKAVMKPKENGIQRPSPINADAKN